MAAANAVAIQWCACHSSSGCSALLPMPIDCLLTLHWWSGRIQRAPCRRSGLVAARVRRFDLQWMARVQVRTRTVRPMQRVIPRLLTVSSFPCSPPGQTRCLVPPTWWLRRSIRWWRVWWHAAATRGSRSMWRGRRIDRTSIAKNQRRRPASQQACLPSIQRPARAFPSGPRTMCSWATEPARSWRCLRTTSATLNLPRNFRFR